MKLLKLLVICIVIIGLGFTGIACKVRGGLYGIVEFESSWGEGIKAAGVTITATKIDNPQSTFTSISNNDGKYSINVSEEGDYHITIDFTNATNKPEGFVPKGGLILKIYELGSTESLYVENNGYIIVYNAQYISSDLRYSAEVNFSLLAY